MRPGRLSSGALMMRPGWAWRALSWRNLAAPVPARRQVARSRSRQSRLSAASGRAGPSGGREDDNHLHFCERRRQVGPFACSLRSAAGGPPAGRNISAPARGRLSRRRELLVACQPATTTTTTTAGEARGAPNERFEGAGNYLARSGAPLGPAAATRNTNRNTQVSSRANLRAGRKWRPRRC